jgi:hypothetical protein
MKCSNPDCNRGIGLVHHRRGWFSKRRNCLRNCRDAFVADLSRSQKEPSAATYFEWLFLQPSRNSTAEVAATNQPPAAYAAYQG